MPPQWSNWKHLKVLELENIAVEGSIPHDWRFPTLSRIAFRNLPNIKGTIPENITTSSSKMVYFELSNLTRTRVTIGDIQKLMNVAGNSLEHLILTSLDLQGNIKDFRASKEGIQYSQLKEITLSHNNISGALPSDWSNVVSLEVLRLDENILSGSVPDEWSTLTRLLEVNFSGNAKLCGPVPDWLEKKFNATLEQRIKGRYMVLLHMRGTA